MFGGKVEGRDLSQPLGGVLVSRCEKMVAASKRLTIHHSPNVLTVCLKRFDAFTGRKITKVAIQHTVYSIQYKYNIQYTV